jgi:hypothetical protein
MHQHLKVYRYSVTQQLLADKKKPCYKVTLLLEIKKMHNQKQDTMCTLTAVFSATTTAVSPALAKRLTQPARLDRIKALANYAISNRTT